MRCARSSSCTEVESRELDSDDSTPRLRGVIAVACDAFEGTQDRALRELLAELILALGHDQDTRVEMGADDAARWLEALRQVREFRP